MSAASKSDVVVGSKWRNRKSGIVAEVIERNEKFSTVRLKRERRGLTTKWIDLLLHEYELVRDEPRVAKCDCCDQRPGVRKVTGPGGIETWACEECIG